MNRCYNNKYLKNVFVVNGQPVTVSFDLGKVVACNTLFVWSLTKKIKAYIKTKNNALISGLLGEQFKLEMMVLQRYQEAPKTPEGIPVSFPSAIQ